MKSHHSPRCPRREGSPRGLERRLESSGPEMPNQVRVARNEAPADGGTFIVDLVEAWLTSIRSRHADGDRSHDLLKSYRALALRIVGDGAHRAPHKKEHETDVARFDRELWDVATTTRRAGLRIADTVDDLAHLQVTIVEWVGAATSGDSVLDSLERVVQVLLVLNSAGQRLVRILEESAFRSRREHSAALAATMDMLSHELGNRLGAAMTASEMLLSPSVDLNEQGLTRAAELVRSSVDAALHTVEDVRALAATRSNIRESPTRGADLSSLIGSVVDRLRPDAEDAEVEIQVAGELVSCRVDAARLRLIVFNLVGNGIKYHDPSKPHRWVRIDTAARGDQAELRVTDNGVGIPKEDLAGVFRYRRRGSTTDAQPGSGLGLAIVREAAEQIGGEIVVQSKVGDGTRFTVTFTPIEQQPIGNS